jgi:two-component system sensor histidine kinase KdpD
MRIQGQPFQDSGAAGASTGSALASDGPRGWLGDAAILVLATLGTYGALVFDRPRTAVLVYLLGVLLVGARSGLYRGVLAALAASFIYNFFLSEPVFRLGAGSLDELVPLLAFNLCAIISGGLAGRLNDRARAAREAEAKNALLLELSDQLQRAITATDVVTLARQSLGLHGVELLGIDLSNARGELGPPLAATMPPRAAMDDPEVRTFDLTGSEGDLGQVRFGIASAPTDRQALPDLQAISNLLALAVDRCLLLEQLSEGRAAMRSEELKSALLSSVSHDLRTPLTAIEAAATSLQAFRDTLGPAQQDDMLATIAEQCAKLNRYTANLLDMGRIQAGISPSQLEIVDLAEILGVALGAIRKRFPDQEIAKEVAIPAASVSANAAMLEQMIFNLLENAVLHGGGGKPILVRLTLDAAHCYLEITDSGPGIAAAEQTRVFERFYRGQQRVQREGSGLGLYIARGFVEAFGGTIAVNSPVIDNHGTTLTVCLPLVPLERAKQDIDDAYPDR